MNLIRELHDELSDQLAQISYEIDSLIGDEQVGPTLRSSARSLQEGLGKLVDLLREEVIATQAKGAPIFSIAIRELIGICQRQVETFPDDGLSQKIKSALAEVLAFPKTFLEASARRTAASYELTKRELEILRLLPNGLSSKLMATSLFLTEATIKTHTASLYRKLEVNNRTQAIAVGLEVGLLKR